MYYAVALELFFIFSLVVASIFSHITKENMGIGFIQACVIVGLACALYNYSMLDGVTRAIVEHPIYAVAIFVGYYVVGGLYTLFWRYRVFLDEHEDSIKIMLIRYNGEEDVKNKFGVVANGHLIYSWIVGWPFSLLLNILHRPIIYVKTIISKSLSFSYDNKIASIKNSLGE